MLHLYNYKTMYLCSVKQCMLSTLYSVWGTWLFPSLEGFNGSNTHRCSAHMKHFSRKWAASADLGCQTITSQIFAAFSFYFSSSALKIYWQRFWKCDQDPRAFMLRWKFHIMLFFIGQKCLLLVPFRSGSNPKLCWDRKDGREGISAIWEGVNCTLRPVSSGSKQAEYLLYWSWTNSRQPANQRTLWWLQYK